MKKPNKNLKTERKWHRKKLLAKGNGNKKKGNLGFCTLIQFMGNIHVN